jgi:drug/metabolite transporter (DMT)-like permease
MALVAAWLVSSPPAGLSAFAWGGGAGLAYGAGLLLLYRGLAVGRMSVVAPITAVCALTFPVVFGVLLGEHPGTWALVGIVFAILAIGLVSREASSNDAASGGAAVRGAEPGGGVAARAVVMTAIASGVGFAGFFICLSRTASSAGLWPLVASRVVTIGGFVAVGLGTRQPIRIPRGAVYLAAAGGLVDVCANTCYVLSVRSGMISLAATLTSLYPVTTVVLARLVLRERIGWLQALGLGCALAAVVLITAL